MNTRRLYRCTHDRMLAGVASGVAEYFDVDPTVVRVIWALGTIFTGGALFILYIIMAIVVPLEPDGVPAPGPWQPGADQWGAPQWASPNRFAGWPAGQQPSASPNTTGAPGTPGAPGAPGAAGTDATAGEAGAAAAASGDPSATSQTAYNPGYTQGYNAGYTPGYGAPGYGAPAYGFQDNWYHTRSHADRRPGNFSVYFGIVLIMLGALALADQWIHAVNLWPLVIVGIGILFVVNAVRSRDERDARNGGGSDVREAVDEPAERE